MTTLSGVWLPIVAPFHDDAVDFASYERLLDHSLGLGVSGIFPLGTTGESPTLDDDETEAIVARTLAVVAGRVPVFVGIGGNATEKTLKLLKRLDRHDFPGIVLVCPYYNRPTQDGLREHFARIAAAIDRQVVIYNIPYRTGVNLVNDTLLELAERPNIVGVKDSCGSLVQSLDLLRRRSAGFSVMTGEDNLYYTMLAHGADGGILASAHLETGAFVGIHRLMAGNDHRAARRVWSRVEALVPMLFREANPMPVKYCLWRQGLLRSPYCRPIAAARFNRMPTAQRSSTKAHSAAIRLTTSSTGKISGVPLPWNVLCPRVTNSGLNDYRSCTSSFCRDTRHRYLARRQPHAQALRREGARRKYQERRRARVRRRSQWRSSLVWRRITAAVVELANKVPRCLTFGVSSFKASWRRR
jgi:4-hydroxy-tetrahydrodipicolinate synthase